MLAYSLAITTDIMAMIETPGMLFGTLSHNILILASKEDAWVALKNEKDFSYMLYNNEPILIIVDK